MSKRVIPSDIRAVLGVVRDVLLADAEGRDWARLPLADLYEEAGDIDTAAILRGKTFVVWAIPQHEDDVIVLVNDSGRKPKNALPKCRREFTTRAEMDAFRAGKADGLMLTEEDRDEAGLVNFCFDTPEACLAELRNIWLDWDDDYGDGDDYGGSSREPEDDDDWDVHYYGPDEDDPHIQTLPPADGAKEPT